MEKKTKIKKIFRIFRIILYFIAFLYLLVKEPNGEYTFIICPSKSLFNVDCYLCGMTRAFISMFHFKFINALNYNPLVIVIYPLLILLAIQDTFVILKNLINKKESLSFLEFIFKKI